MCSFDKIPNVLTPAAVGNYALATFGFHRKHFKTPELGRYKSFITKKIEN